LSNTLLAIKEPNKLAIKSYTVRGGGDTDLNPRNKYSRQIQGKKDVDLEFPIHIIIGLGQVYLETAS